MAIITGIVARIINKIPKITILPPMVPVLWGVLINDWREKLIPENPERLHFF